MRFQKPETLEGLNKTELIELRKAALEEARELSQIADAELTKEQGEDIKALANILGEIDESIVVATANEEALAAARAAVATAEDIEVEAVAEAEEEAEVEEQPEAVAASAAPSLRSVARKQEPVVPVQEHAQETLNRMRAYAAADVSGFASGAELQDMNDVAKAAMARFSPLKNKTQKNSFTSYGIASFKRFTDEFKYSDTKLGEFAGNSEHEKLQQMIAEVSDESRLPGQSLTAATGWCAPSENDYSLPGIEGEAGLIDLPTIGINRGGINLTKGPDLSSLAYDGFHLTETQVESDTEKDIYTIDCPEFTEYRLDAIGFGIRAGILTNNAYPELIRRYVDLVSLAHRYRESAVTISKLQALMGAATTFTNPWPNAYSVLSVVELIIEGERQRYKLPDSATMEVIVPKWLRAALRADLSNRTGVDLISVTDARLDAHFAERGARVQYVYYLTDLAITDSAGAVIPQSYPDTFEMFVYPAGAYVKGVSDVINLSAIYDSTDIRTNEYTVLFAESGLLVANRVAEGRRVEVPLSVTGLTASAIINQNLGEVPPVVSP